MARKQRVAQALAQAPRGHSRARACFMRTHSDDSHERATYLGHRFDKAALQAAAPPPVASAKKVRAVPPRGQVFYSLSRRALTHSGPHLQDADVGAMDSSLSQAVLWRLRGWVDEMLSGGGYNVLMQAARKELEPGLGISR